MRVSSNASGFDKSQLTDEMIQQVNNIPVQKYFDEIIVPELGIYYSNYTVDFNMTLRTLCPLHNEDKPSFFYIPDGNKFHCFGCNSHGSLIDLHMKYQKSNNSQNIRFVQAVTWLHKRFIEGADVAPIDNIRKLSEKEKVSLSTKDEVTYLNAYIGRIFGRLRRCGLSPAEKVKVYYDIDCMRKMVYANDIGVKDVTDALFLIYKSVTEKI